MSGASYMVRPSSRKEKEEGSNSPDRQLPLPAAVQHATDFFPAKEYRPGQREAIEQIEDAFINKHYRFVVAELPTGLGKSLIAYTFSKYFKSAHILTVQKILQKQYEDTFHDIFSMQGRGSYTCLRERNLSCAKGPCRRTKTITDSDCPYKVASYQAHASKITVHNFDGFYYQNKGRPYDRRDILICDECFVPSTLVTTDKGEQAISTICAGQSVLSFNSDTGKLAYNRVSRIFQKSTSCIYKLILQNGHIIYSTGNHRYWTTRGWVAAADLQPHLDFVLSIEYNTKYESKRKSFLSLFKDKLFRVWQTFYNNKCDADSQLQIRALPWNLLLSRLWNEIKSSTANRARYAFGGSGEGIYPNEEKQSYVYSRDKSKSLRLKILKRKLETSLSGREWKTNASASEVTGNCSSLAYRSSDYATGKEQGQEETLLQDRHCKCGPKNSHRSRWEVPLFFKGKGAGSKERAEIGGVRLESVEILKQGSSEEFGRVCPESTVYDLEVANDHTYIANSCIVHNCHALENKYLGFMSFTLSNKSRREWALPDFKLAKQYKDFCEEEKKNLDIKIQYLEDQDCLLAEEIVALEDMQELSLKLSIFISKVEGMEYVVDYVDNKEWQTVTFRPLFVGSFIQDTLFPKGEKVLLLSATILSKKHFCDSIGVNPDEVAFIQMGSCFPVKNRPIVKRYAGSMSYKEIDKTLPKSLEIVKQILDKFPTKRGIIQTHSEKIASYIKNNLSDSRLTFRRDFTTVEGMLEEHRIKENSFIVASGLREGLDLREDMSRVQIIMKVPYLDLGDSRTKRRKEIDPSWYGLQTALLFVQTIGRSVRSEQDKAITYILDSSFDMFLNINKKFIPDYIREAIL